MAQIQKFGKTYDGCERCECEFEDKDDYRRSEGGYHSAHNLDLCEECAGSFSSWIRCKIG